MRVKALVLALLILAGARAGTAATLAVSRGTYTDAAGGKHPWQISAAHALVWDGAPYLPAGGAWAAASWSAAPTEADWNNDVAALARLKERGVTDLYVRPAPGVGITRVKPEHIQRLVDHLEKEGFTYGISLSDGPRSPLIGYEVRPGAYRKAGVGGGNSAVSVRIPAADTGTLLYVAVPPATGGLAAEALVGEAARVGGGARVDLPPLPAETVVFLLPEKIHLPGDGLGLPNVWDGFGAYRDAVLALFGQVKLGPHFRFFVDALPADLGLGDEASHLLPTGPGFAGEWGSWLANRYRHVDQIHQAWALPGRELRQVGDAVHLLPLWSGGKGVSAFYDRRTGALLKVGTREGAEISGFWADLHAFQAESLRGYMNALADVLKREVADVPVVYRWTGSGSSALFAPLPVRGGFDGIGIDAFGRGGDLVTQTGGYAYARAAESPKTLWLPVTATGYAANEKVPGFPTRGALFDHLDWLRQIGAKAFFIAAGAATPDQLTWLSGYRAMLAAAPGAAEEQPGKRVLFYPRALAGASPRLLPSGRWWLPTDRPAVTIDFGPVGRGYGLSEDGDGGGGMVYTLWNPAGPRQIRVRLPKMPRGSPAPDVRASAPLTERRGVLTLTVGPEPISLYNMPVPPVPLEAFPETAREADALIAAARRQGRLEAGRFGQQLSFLRRQYKDDNPGPLLIRAQEIVAALRFLLRPYLWFEAEIGGIAHTFDESRERPGASESRVLAVGARPPDLLPAIATYPLRVAETGEYHLWVSATPGAPLSFRIDGQPVSPGEAPQPRGTPYADDLVWSHVGLVTLPKGPRSLEMRADGPAVVDALLLIRGDFTPDGPNPPPVVVGGK